ncbi:hypothetical protein [Cupriavidus necator]|nr:hypothetical protein [Cupriavidus necator]
MTSLYYSMDEAFEIFPCIIKISDEEILVEYEYDGVQQYRGRNNGDGHFELVAPELKGRASLHMFPGSSILEGSWVEGSYRGMWRIELGDE